MRINSDRPGGADGPSIYAPKWARKVVQTEPRATLYKINTRGLGQQTAEQPAEPAARPRDNSLDSGYSLRASMRASRRTEDLYVEHLIPDAAQTGLIESIAMPEDGRRRRFWPISLTVAALVAAILAIGGIPYPRSNVTLPDRPETANSSATQPPEGPAATLPTAPTLSTARLVVTPPSSGTTNAALPLGLSLAGEGGVALMFSGLAVGTELSGGAPSGTDGWRLSVKDIDHVKIWPPRDFVGPMDVTVDLHLADGTVADHQVLHFEWNRASVSSEQPAIAQPAVAASAAPQTAAPTGGATKTRASSEPKDPQIYQLDRTEVARLIERAQSFIATKDIASARLVLKRAAAVNDPQAALILGTTYDPVLLGKLGVPVSFADLEAARSWYAKAKELGSSQAAIRLRTLSAEDR